MFLAFAGFSLLLTSCEESSTTQNPDTAIADTVKVSTSGTFLLDGEIFSIPSPVQTALLLKKEKVNFQQDLLNPVENRGKYLTEVQKAMNLGVYGADLAFVSCQDNAQLSMNYFDAVGKLSADIGILDNIDKSFVQRFMDNAGEGDSLIALNADFYRAGDRYLKDNKNTKTAVLILLGGWVESLHLAINSAAGNAAILQRIGEQRDAVTSLARLTASLDDPGLIDLKKNLSELSQVFADLKSTYEYKQPIVDAQKQRTFLTSKTVVTMDTDQLAEIAGLVDAIRKNIIQ